MVGELVVYRDGTRPVSTGTRICPVNPVNKRPASAAAGLVGVCLPRREFPLLEGDCAGAGQWAGVMPTIQVMPKRSVSMP